MSNSEKPADSHSPSDDFDPVLVAFSQTVKGYRDPTSGKRGAAGLAPVVHMIPGVLANKANLTMPECEPTVTQFRSVMLAAKDFTALEQLSADCGGVFVPVKKHGATGDVGLLDQYSAYIAAGGRLSGDIHSALESGHFTQADVQRLTKDAEKQIAELEGFLAKVKDLAEPANSKRR